jgi:hypothetical protein
MSTTLRAGAAGEVDDALARTQRQRLVQGGR